MDATWWGITALNPRVPTNMQSRQLLQVRCPTLPTSTSSSNSSEQPQEHENVLKPSRQTAFHLNHISNRQILGSDLATINQLFIYGINSFEMGW